MAAQSNLYELIHSLSSSEKGYFMKYGYKGKRRTMAYIDLFRSIEKQTVYDEAALKELFNSKTYTTSYQAAKSYLYKMILRALVECHADEAPQDTLLRLIREMSVLQERGMKKA